MNSTSGVNIVEDKAVVCETRHDGMTISIVSFCFLHNYVLCTCILYVTKLYGQDVTCIVIQTSGTEFTVFTFVQANVVC